MGKDASAKSPTFSRRYYGVVLIIVAAISWPLWGPVMQVLLLWTFYGYTPPRQNTPFAEAHQRAINTFVNNRGFGVNRLINHPQYWGELSVHFEGVRYLCHPITLIGLTPEHDERSFENFVPRKSTLARAPHRPLTTEEKEAVTRLRAGEAWVKLAAPPNPAKDTSEDIRVIAPIFAQASCLECHEAKTSALLGAFDYYLHRLPPSEPPNTSHISTQAPLPFGSVFSPPWSSP